ncbi:hypothetical protein COO60DRAFT_1004200 [Scenedesmus sp. NREL 46B-D3]|nr:hypothetical protein COO60DRAFT_1004200 [Scenedesmus sp. NREL 46B-D3]
MELDTATAAADAGAAAAAPAVLQQQRQQEPHGGAAPAAVAPAAAAAGGQDVAPLPADLLLRKLSPLSREVGIQAMVLRLLADYCLLFSNSVGLLLKRDSECGPADVRVPGHHQHAAQQTPGHEGRTPARRSSTRAYSSSGGAASRHSIGGQQQQPDLHKAGVVLKHIMRVQLVEQPPAGSAAAPGVAVNASSLLQAVCIRSGEGRRRIINELVATLSNSSSRTSSRAGSDSGAQQQAAGNAAPSKLPYVCQPGSPSAAQVAACVSLMGALVQSGSGPSRSDPRQPQSSSMPLEVLRAMREAGAVKALAQALNLVSTEHPQAKDAINAILKPLEVLTRTLPKVPAPPADAAAAPAAEAATAAPQPGVRATPAHTSRHMARAATAAATPAAAAAPGAAAGQQQRPAGAAAAPPAGAAAPAAGAAATPGAAGGGGAGGRSSGESGGRAAMEEDQRQPAHQHAGEEAAGPDALAAAGRFVAGGAAGPAAEEVPGQLIDHLMDQLVDIEVELDAGDDEDDDDDDSEDDSGSGSEHGSGSDEDMSEGQQHGQEHGDAGGGDGGMADAPSLTEDSEEDHTGDSDDAGDAGIIMGDAGAAFIDAGAAAAVGNGPGQLLDDLGSSDEDPDSEDGGDGHHHHADAFEDALLAEEEMQMMADHMGGHVQDGVGVDAMDDEDDEEDEYLEEEGSDDEEGWEEEAGEGPLSLDMLEQPMDTAGLDELPAALMVPNLGGFGRLGRRAMYRPAGAAAAAGVWDDMDGADAGQDALLGGVPMTTVQMLLSQLGINANANSVALMGPNGRQLRLPATMMMPDAQDPAAAAAAPGGSEAVNGAITSAMQSLTMQLMPQQHRLLALPPRLPAAESAALLPQQASRQAQRAPRQLAVPPPLLLARRGCVPAT